MPVTDPRALIRRRVLGALVLSAALAAVVLLWKRPDPFAVRDVVRAELSDASGLAPIGAEVRVAGVPVGKVTGVLRAGDAARLTMTIDPSAGVVRRDATLVLRPRLLFEGTAYVELTLGSPSAPPLRDGVIPRTHTSIYVSVSDALSALSAENRHNVRTLATSAADALSGAAPAQLRGAIAAAPELTRDTALLAHAVRGPDATELRAAVGSLGRVAAAVASQAPALGSSVVGASQVSAALDVGHGSALDSTLAQLPGTAADLRAGAIAASRVLAGLAPLTQRLRAGVSDLAPTLSYVRPLLRRTVPILNAARPVLRDVRTAVTGASAGAPVALTATRALRPTLGILQGTLLGALERPTDLGTPAYLAFLGLFAGGGGASRPFGVDGEGHFMRFGLRFLTGAGLPLPPCTLLDKASPVMGAALEAAGGCTP